MIVFNDLRITPDGENLLIDAMVAPYGYFKDMYISSISIDTEGTFSTGKPSSNAVVVYENQDTTVKEHSINITPDRFKFASLNGHIFYVYVTVAGTPSADTPCTMDTEYTLGVALSNSSISITFDFDKFILLISSPPSSLPTYPNGEPIKLLRTPSVE